MYFFILYKNMQAYKPGSVICLGRYLIIYLVPISLSGSINLPITQTERAAPCYLFGFSTHKVYPAIDVTINAVSSYLTFSPLPFEALAKMGNPMSYTKTLRPFDGSLFSVALSVTDEYISPFPLGSVVLYVARTFLPDGDSLNIRTIRRLAYRQI